MADGGDEVLVDGGAAQAVVDQVGLVEHVARLVEGDEGLAQPGPRSRIAEVTGGGVGQLESLDHHRDVAQPLLGAQGYLAEELGAAPHQGFELAAHLTVARQSQGALGIELGHGPGQRVDAGRLGVANAIEQPSQGGVQAGIVGSQLDQALLQGGSGADDIWPAGGEVVQKAGVLQGDHRSGFGTGLSPTSAL